MPGVVVSSSHLVTAAPTSCRQPRPAAATQKSPASNISIAAAAAAGSTGGAVSARTIGSISGQQQTANYAVLGRRELAAILTCSSMLPPAAAALAASDEEYVKDTNEVIKIVRTTVGMDKTDPNVADAVAGLRDASNSWVAKYRKEKSLLGRASFRDMYSALNAVSGHYISFGPTAPLPAKRKARILEEVDTAEKALLRGR